MFKSITHKGMRTPVVVVDGVEDNMFHCINNLSNKMVSTTVATFRTTGPPGADSIEAGVVGVLSEAVISPTYQLIARKDSNNSWISALVAPHMNSTQVPILDGNITRNTHTINNIHIHRTVLSHNHR